METLYFHFHHNTFPTTEDRYFILGLNVYLTQSHTLNVEGQGQGHEFGSKVKKKAQDLLLWRNIYHIRHACVSETVAHILC